MISCDTMEGASDTYKKKKKAEEKTKLVNWDSAVHVVWPK